MTDGYKKFDILNGAPEGLDDGLGISFREEKDCQCTDENPRVAHFALAEDTIKKEGQHECVEDEQGDAEHDHWPHWDLVVHGMEVCSSNIWRGMAGRKGEITHFSVFRVLRVVKR